MRIKNVTSGIYRRHWARITARDLVVLGGCLLYEPASLPALWRVARSFSRTLAKRRAIMERRRVDDTYLVSWFGDEPAAQPVSELAFR